MSIDWQSLSAETQAAIARNAVAEVAIIIAEEAQLFAGSLRNGLAAGLAGPDALLAFAARVRALARQPSGSALGMAAVNITTGFATP